jgi:hypothetical protein
MLPNDTLVCGCRRLPAAPGRYTEAATARVSARREMAMDTDNISGSPQGGRLPERPLPSAEVAGRRVFGRMRGRITMSEDFDDPLPDQMLAAFYDGPIEPER